MPSRSRKPTLAPVTLSESEGVRYLHLGTPWVQGAMRIRKPHAIELEYVQRMMAWLLLHDEAALEEGHAVQLGLGAGSITRFCHKVLRWRTTAVEINPGVIGACRTWFHLPEDDERLSIVQADAGAFVRDEANAGCANALCVDLYDHEAASPVLDDELFYRACRDLLADGGVMSVNLFGRDVSFSVSAHRIAKVFGDDHVAMLKPTREGNTIVLAWRGFELPAREVLAERAQSLETRLRLPARKWLRLLQPLQTRRATAA
jgi:spermidine synthase